MLEFFTSFFHRQTKASAVQNYYHNWFHRVPVGWFAQFHRFEQMPCQSYVHLVYDEAEVRWLDKCFDFESESTFVEDGKYAGWFLLPDTQIYGVRLRDCVALAIDELNDETFPKWECLLALLVDRFGCDDCKKSYQRLT